MTFESVDSAVSWSEREQARLRMLRLRALERNQFDAVIERALSICASTLRVSRVGLWSFQERQTRLVLTHVVDHECPAEQASVALSVAELASYVELLQLRRCIAVADVRKGSLLSPVFQEYYAPRNVTATLDAPIFRDGQVTGVVCAEQRGEGREWTHQEADFVMSVADILSQLLLSAEVGSLTERLRQLETNLQEARFSETLVRVARGISHDINGLLAVILANVSLLERDWADAQVRERCLREIREVGRGGSRLATTLITYGTPNQGTLRRLAIDEALSASLGVWASVGRARQLRFLPGASGARVFIDPGFLEQIMLNLVTNAVEATGERGLIEVRTSKDEHGRQVLIEVIDDGHGMDEVVKATCFDPFVSTRGEPQRGLGLSTVSGLVRSAGGTVEVASSPNQGTKFSIRLPLAD